MSQILSSLRATDQAEISGTLWRPIAQGSQEVVHDEVDLVRLEATVPVDRSDDFERIHVKGEEDVDLGAALQPDADAALPWLLAEMS